MLKKILTSTLFLLVAILAAAQGTETFTNIPASSNSYSTRTWTGDNSITWTATDARTDQTINGKAIAYRNGSLTSGIIAGGIGDISFQYKYLFTTGGDASLTVKVNNITVGIISVPMTQTTPALATINNVNIAGSVIIEIQQTVSGARIAIDDLSWTAAGPACTPPPTQVTNAIISNTTATTFDVTWTAGSGTNSLVVVKANSPVTGNPVSGSSYTANTVFGSGSTLSAGEYVVYNGNGTTVSVSGLSSGTQYYVYVYTFNSSDNCYNTTSPANTSAVTTCLEPTVQTNNITISPSTTSATISWSGGNGGSSLVKLNSINTFTAPLDGTTYTANTVYASGEQVIYSGMGGSVSISGLTSNVTYYATVYTFNNCAGTPDYLTSGNISQAFTTISAANYYNSITTQTCSDLKTALSNIINTGVVLLNYGSIDDLYHPTTDDHLNDAGTQIIVWDIYSDNPTGPEPYTYTFSQSGSSASAEGQGWNKEHTFPNSWFSPTSSTSNFPGSDLHQIVPTDIFVNSGRGNLPYGIVGSVSVTYLNGSKKGASLTPIPGYSGEVFEPIDAYKGDVARITLYMVTRYESFIPTWENYQLTGDVVMDGLTYPSIEPGYLQMLLSWAAADPVSQKEIERNETVFGFQGNRNPFVDHPEWIDAIWGTNCTVVPVRLIDFSSTKFDETINLNWIVASEINFRQYEIERSIDGLQFNKIGEVAGRNLSTYSFQDNNLPIAAVVYYRLKMVDADGRFSYSNVIAQRLDEIQGTIIYPNPTSNSVNIKLAKGVTEQGVVIVSDVTGRIVKKQIVTINQANILIDVQDLSAGRYFVQLTNGIQLSQTSFVIIK